MAAGQITGTDRWEAALRWIARIWAEVAIVGYLLWQATMPSPVRGEGDYWERLASLAVIIVIAIGHVVSWRWEIQGATVMAVGGALLALLTLFRTEAYEAVLTENAARRNVLMILIGFAVPAFLYWLIWRRGRSHRRVVGLAVLLTVLVLGTSGLALGVFRVAYGPMHPASELTALPDSPVVWLWAGPPTATSLTVAARVRDPQADLSLVVSTDPDLRNPVTFPARSRADDDPAVARFNAEGLAPATRYYYAVAVDGTPDTVRIGTLATPQGGPQELTIAVGACIRTGSNGSVFDTIRAARPDLFLITGDFGYEDFWTQERAPIRAMYDAQLTSPAISALLREVPTAYVWDDHDFGPNDADSTAASGPAAQVVYRQSVPYQMLPAGPGPEAVYQSFVTGRVRFILTDGRSERSPKSDPDDADKTMLGIRQKQWLAGQLQQAAQAGQFIVLTTNVPWNGAPAAQADDWAGYTTERTEVADMIQAAGVADQLLMVAGDAHMVAIDDGSHTDFSTAAGAAGFPLLQAAALDRNGSFKAGPYSQGAHPGGGQFGLIRIIDGGGGDLDVQVRGTNYDDEPLVTYRFSVPAAALATP